MLFRLQPQQDGYKDERLVQFYQQLFARLDKLPGVRVATFGKAALGIRMALGAQAANVLRLVVWQGMRLVLLGLAVGAVTGYGLKRLLASQYFAEDAWQRQMAEQLYGVKGTDPLTFFVIAALLTLVALVACWLPAQGSASRSVGGTSLRVVSVKVKTHLH